MDVSFDFSDVDTFFDKAESEVTGVMDEVGHEADQYDVAHGSYKNRTGTLRKSNRHKAAKDGLLLYNDAASPKGYHYASNVESKGFEVRSGGALYAEKRLREELE